MKLKRNKTKKTTSSKAIKVLKKGDSKPRNGIGQFLFSLFQGNEKAPSKKKLIDPKIKEMLEKKFGRKQMFLDISNLRAMYNRGAYSQGKKPKLQSRRFNVDGQPMGKHERYPNNIGPVDGSYKTLSAKEKGEIKAQQAKYRAKAAKEAKKPTTKKAISKKVAKKPKTVKKIVLKKAA
jgi:hypothetical protein